MGGDAELPARVLASPFRRHPPPKPRTLLEYYLDAVASSSSGRSTSAERRSTSFAKRELAPPEVVADLVLAEACRRRGPQTRSRCSHRSLPLAALTVALGGRWDQQRRPLPTATRHEHTYINEAAAPVTGDGLCNISAWWILSRLCTPRFCKGKYQLSSVVSQR